MIYFYLVVFLGIIIFGVTMYWVLMSHFKKRTLALSKHANEEEIELKNQGVDQEYRRMNTEQLLELYEKLIKGYDPKSDIKKIANEGVRAKFIEDILSERNVEIPTFESVKE
jgi:hypothetical protein